MQENLPTDSWPEVTDEYGCPTHDNPPADPMSGWTEGIVVRSEPHFLFLFGAQEGALLGRGVDGYIVEWLADDPDLRKTIEFSLGFFLKSKGTIAARQMGRWTYLRHYAEFSGAGVYAKNRVRYIRPSPTPKTSEAGE